LWYPLPFIYHQDFAHTATNAGITVKQFCINPGSGTQCGSESVAEALKLQTTMTNSASLALQKEHDTLAVSFTVHQTWLQENLEYTKKLFLGDRGWLDLP